MTLAAWVQIILLTLLMAAIFRFSLLRLFLKTNPITGESNWGHSFCVPVIGIYYLYLNRDELFRQPVVPLTPGRFNRLQLISSGAVLIAGLLGCLVAISIHPSARLLVVFQGTALLGILSLAMNWGMGTLLFGLALFGYGIWPGQNDFVKDFGAVVTLFGLVLLLCGWKVMRVAWFPILFLICAIPWPGLVYSWVASPLQQFAATLAVAGLNVLGVDSTRSGTKIFISSGILGQPPHALNVAEACAGLRSLMTFISVAIAVAFLSARPLWQRFLVSISAIPIAIFCNVLRVTGTGLLYRYEGPDWAEGFTHQFVGLIMLVPAFFLILSVCWVLDHLFVEEVDPGGAPVRKVIGRGPPPPNAGGNEPPARPPVPREPNAPRRPVRRPANGGLT